MRSFVKVKPSRNSKSPLSFIDIGKPCLIGEFFTSQICLLMLFAKIKFSRKFPNLQYLQIRIVESELLKTFPLEWNRGNREVELHEDNP